MKNKRHAFITGGATGIGLAISKKLASQGYSLTLASRNEENLESVKKEFQCSGTNILTIKTDVTSLEDCYSAINESIKFQPLDVVVNCAGIYKSARFLDQDLDEIKEVFNVNLFSAFVLMKASIPFLLKREHGRIINIASTAGKWASPNQATYNSSKHALLGLTKCAALEFGATNLRINSVCPGLVETEMSEKLIRNQANFSSLSESEFRKQFLSKVSTGKLIEPEECASLVAYLASEEATGINGQSFVVDGGMLYI